MPGCCGVYQWGLGGGWEAISQVARNGGLPCVMARSGWFTMHDADVNNEFTVSKPVRVGCCSPSPGWGICHCLHVCLNRTGVTGI